MTRPEARAIQQWPIGDEVRHRVLDRLYKIACESASDRQAISAARAVISADTLNLKRELKAGPDRQIHTVDDGVTVSGIVQEMLTDRDFLEYLRKDALKAHG